MPHQLAFAHFPIERRHVENLPSLKPLSVNLLGENLHHKLTKYLVSTCVSRRLRSGKASEIS